MGRADGLMKNKWGKVVSKRSSAAWARRGKDWIDATVQARQVLNLKGFVAVNGKSLQGKALYLKAKTAYEDKRAKQAALPLQYLKLWSTRTMHEGFALRECVSTGQLIYAFCLKTKLCKLRIGW